MNMRTSAPLLALLSFIIGCGGPAANEDELASRTERADGVVEVTYSSLPDDRVVIATSDLVIGSEDRGDEYIFGDIRAIEPAGDGSIYVLDNQASEIRAFNATGNFLRTVAGPGQGPGEIAEANGMALVGDTVLWVHDYGKWRMTGIRTMGGEMAAYPMPILSYAYIFTGTIDNSGRYWKVLSVSDEPMQGPSEPGYSERGYDAWYLSYDYRTGERDSLYLGHAYSRTVMWQIGNGFRFYPIPYLPGESTIVDPAGGFWHVREGDYRLSRLDAAGEPVLVINVGMEPLHVTREDRDRVLARGTPDDPDSQQAVQTVVSYMPDVKPLVSEAVLDDERRVWVSRVVEADENPIYDVFTEEGEYAGTVQLEFQVHSYFPIRVRDDRIYAFGEDDLGAPVVKRSAPINFDASRRGSEVTP